MPRFTDQVLLITGAASGIGRAATMKLAAEGANLFVTDASCMTSSACRTWARTWKSTWPSGRTLRRVVLHLVIPQQLVEQRQRLAGVGVTASRLEERAPEVGGRRWCAAQIRRRRKRYRYPA